VDGIRAISFARDTDMIGTMTRRRNMQHSLRIANGAQLYGFGARSLFVGPALQLSPHRNAVAVLAVALDQPFRLSVSAHDNIDARRYRTCRSALIAPNAFHHLDAPGRVGILHVDAMSLDYEHLRTLVGELRAGAGFDLQAEPQLIDWLRRLHAGGRSVWPQVRVQLESLLGNGVRRVPDTRIIAALQVMRDDLSVRPSLAELARHAGLSPSRFIHLFKQTTGVPLRRYKLWVAMSAATRLILRGANVTTASAEAGFASSAHFSSAYREMFGMEPSRLTQAVQKKPTRKLRTTRGHTHP